MRRLSPYHNDIVMVGSLDRLFKGTFEPLEVIIPVDVVVDECTRRIYRILSVESLPARLLVTMHLHRHPHSCRQGGQRRRQLVAHRTAYNASPWHTMP